MLTTIRYILLTARRDWIFMGLAVALFAVFAVSSFLGGTSLVEQQQMTAVFVGSATRLVLIIGLILFVCFHVRRAFEHREVEFILTRPISRTRFVLSYWLGFFTVSLWLLLPLLGAMLLLLPGLHLAGLAWWGASLMLEIAVILAFALFVALILRSAVSAVLLCFGFYVMARMMGFFLYLLDKPYDLATLSFNALLHHIMTLLSALMPRLDLFGQTEWLIYGTVPVGDFRFVALQAAITIPLLLGMALLDFARRDF